MYRTLWILCFPLRRVAAQPIIYQIYLEILGMVYLVINYYYVKKILIS